MTRSNRTLNRLILALLGLVSLAAAAALVATWFDIPGVAALVPTADALARALGDPTTLWIAAAAAAVAAVLAIAWIATRGRGRTSAAWETDTLRVDGRVVEDVLQARLAANPDVLGVSATPYRLRGSRVIGVRVVCRRRAAMPLLLQDLRRAVDELDTTLGTPLPLLVHLSSGARSRLRAATATR